MATEIDRTQSEDQVWCHRCKAAVPNPRGRAGVWTICDTCSDQMAIEETRLDEAVADPADFWTKVRMLDGGPAIVLALVRAAPKIAGPWQDEPEAQYPSAMARRTPAGECVADVFRESRTAMPRYITPEGSGDCESLAEGRSVADALLRKAGWVLVDDQ